MFFQSLSIQILVLSYTNNSPDGCPSRSRNFFYVENAEWPPQYCNYMFFFSLRKTSKTIGKNWEKCAFDSFSFVDDNPVIRLSGVATKKGKLTSTTTMPSGQKTKKTKHNQNISGLRNQSKDSPSNSDSTPHLTPPHSQAPSPDMMLEDDPDDCDWIPERLSKKASKQKEKAKGKFDWA